MRRLTILAGFALALVLAPSSAQAQFAATQDSTLTGIKRVYVNFADVGGGTGTAAAELENTVSLELRKAGIRVVRDAHELTNDDAILNVGFVSTRRAMSTDLAFKIDVEQMAQLQRTKQTLRMVTWYYEQNALNAYVKDEAPKMLTKGINEFISKWLDMNGR